MELIKNSNTTSFKLFFRSERKLKDIKLPYQPNVDNQSADDWTQSIGKAPFIFLPNMEDENGGGIILENSDIVRLKIINDDFLPRLEMIFYDTLNIIGSKFHPTDKTYISFFKKSESDLLMPIRVDFIINHFRMVKEKSGDNDNKLYSLKANLHFNNITIYLLIL